MAHNKTSRHSARTHTHAHGMDDGKKKRKKHNTHRFHNRIIPAILAQICISVCVKVNYYLFFVHRSFEARAHQNRSELPHRWLGKSEMESLIAKVWFDQVAMRSSDDAPVKRNVNNDTNVYDYYDYLEAVGGGDGGHCRTIDTRRYRYCRFRTLIHTHPTRSTSNSSLVRWRWTTENL